MKFYGFLNQKGFALTELMAATAIVITLGAVVMEYTSSNQQVVRDIASRQSCTSYIEAFRQSILSVGQRATIQPLSPSGDDSDLARLQTVPGPHTKYKTHSGIPEGDVFAKFNRNTALATNPAAFGVSQSAGSILIRTPHLYTSDISALAAIYNKDRHFDICTNDSFRDLTEPLAGLLPSGDRFGMINAQPQIRITRFNLDTGSKDCSASRAPQKYSLIIKPRAGASRRLVPNGERADGVPIFDLIDTVKATTESDVNLVFPKNTPEDGLHVQLRVTYNDSNGNSHGCSGEFKAQYAPDNIAPTSAPSKEAFDPPPKTKKFTLPKGEFSKLGEATFKIKYDARKMEPGSVLVCRNKSRQIKKATSPTAQCFSNAANMTANIPRFTLPHKTHTIDYEGKENQEVDFFKDDVGDDKDNPTFSDFKDDDKSDPIGDSKWVSCSEVKVCNDVLPRVYDNNDGDDVDIKLKYEDLPQGCLARIEYAFVDTAGNLSEEAFVEKTIQVASCGRYCDTKNNIDRFVLNGDCPSTCAGPWHNETLEQTIENTCFTNTITQIRDVSSCTGEVLESTREIHGIKRGPGCCNPLDESYNAETGKCDECPDKQPPHPITGECQPPCNPKKDQSCKPVCNPNLEKNWWPKVLRVCGGRQKNLCDGSTRTVLGTNPQSPKCNPCNPNLEKNWVSSIDPRLSCKPVKQTNKCNGATRTVPPENEKCCEKTEWLPKAPTLCWPKSVTQTRKNSQCKTETRTVVGTKICESPPPCADRGLQVHPDNPAKCCRPRGSATPTATPTSTPIPPVTPICASGKTWNAAKNACCGRNKDNIVYTRHYESLEDVYHFTGHQRPRNINLRNHVPCSRPCRKTGWELCYESPNDRILKGTTCREKSRTPGKLSCEPALNHLLPSQPTSTPGDNPPSTSCPSGKTYNVESGKCCKATVATKGSWYLGGAMAGVTPPPQSEWPSYRVCPSAGGTCDPNSGSNGLCRLIQGARTTITSYYCQGRSTTTYTDCSEPLSSGGSGNDDGGGKDGILECPTQPEPTCADQGLQDHPDGGCCSPAGLAPTPTATTPTCASGKTWNAEQNKCCSGSTSSSGGLNAQTYSVTFSTGTPRSHCPSALSSTSCRRVQDDPEICSTKPRGTCIDQSGSDASQTAIIFPSGSRVESSHCWNRTYTCTPTSTPPGGLNCEPPTNRPTLNNPPSGSPAPPAGIRACPTSSEPPKKQETSCASQGLRNNPSGGCCRPAPSRGTWQRDTTHSFGNGYAEHCSRRSCPTKGTPCTPGESIICGNGSSSRGDGGSCEEWKYVCRGGSSHNSDVPVCR